MEYRVECNHSQIYEHSKEVMPPSLTPGSVLGPRTGDRIPGMPKIKGLELKRAQIYSSNRDPKGQLVHKENS